MEKSLVLCDVDTSYARSFASYMMEHVRNLRISIFTTEESFFADHGSYDYGIMSREFIEVAPFKQNMDIKEIYYLTEDADTEEDLYKIIYKYQDMDSIIKSVTGLSETSLLAKRNSKATSLVTGIYSPISHELQLPFSMALSQIYKETGKILFVDLEELSIMGRLIESENRLGLIDLLYRLVADKEEELRLEDYICSYMGVDYIPPFLSPEDINEINSETYQMLFTKLSKLGYDRIIVLFGRACSGFSEILSSIDQLILISKPGDYYQKSCELFLQYLDALHVETSVQAVQLPMTAGNLSDGTYCIEELLQGKLGGFVRQMVATANG